MLIQNNGLYSLVLTHLYSGIVATVFGSTGFVGRYLVNRLGMHCRDASALFILICTLNNHRESGIDGNAASAMRGAWLEAHEADG